MRQIIWIAIAEFLLMGLVAVFLVYLPTLVPALVDWRGYLIMAVIPYLGYLFWGRFVAIRLMRSSLMYLEENDSERPIFEHTKIRSFEIDAPKDFIFENLKTEITERMTLTFSDEIRGVLKFRSRWRFLTASGGVGAWLKYDRNARKLYLDVFPLHKGFYFIEIVPELRKHIENSVELQNLFALALARYDDIVEEDDD